jgi:asparagine synthase (glutamine-hydrolysing)
MCGIAGYLRRDGAPASAAQARAMADAMPHRGPDGRGAWSDGPVALGHARLAVRERTEAGAQPMVAPGGEGVLVYNGEVYDLAPPGGESVRRALVREGVAFRGKSDAEVVLHAIARWGFDAAVERFDGMFAIAWWDARERALRLARDRFGTKPLHVAVGPDRVAFASEMRGLFALEGVSRRPDLLEVARRAFAPSHDETRPPFEGVENVLPGESWRVTARGVERRTWCDLPFSLDVDRLLAAERERPESWEARVESAVVDAVRAHLVSDVPVAALTSGGVDSNLVASLAREDLPGLVAYTADTTDADSETPAAHAMAERIGFPLRVVRVGREEYLRTWPVAVESLEHPGTHASLPAAYLVAQRAHADGVVVALTGEGADEVFGGYDFFERTRRRWHEGLRAWRRLSRAGRRDAWRLAEVPFRYQVLRREAEAHLRFAATLLPTEETRARLLLERLERVRPAADRAFVAHSLDALRRHLGWILLRHDRVGMAASIEARVPFLSNRVADVGLHLPVRARLRGRVGKWALKRVAARRLPPSLVYARKKGFPIPDAHHRGTTALLRGGAVPELLRWPAAAEADLVPRLESQPLARHQWVGLEIWARIFVRGERPEDVAERLLAC